MKEGDYQSKIGYQGVKGCFGEEAAMTYFYHKGYLFTPYPTFEEVFKAIQSKKVDYGVVPIENSSAGEVVEVYDLIKKYNLSIIGEQILKIEHHLLAVKGTQLDDITEVYSHPQALAQSGVFLKQHVNMQERACLNTGIACQMIANLQDKTKAAIGSKRAAKTYDLEVLEENIHFNPKNCTRFIILGREMSIHAKCDKISVVFTTEHKSGALYHILGYFAKNGLNLLKIHSRPSQEKTWHYFFFVDIEGNLQDTLVQEAFAKVKQESKYFEILGNYIGYKMEE